MSRHADRMKAERISMRIRSSDNRLIREAAALTDRSLSEFMIESARVRSEQLLADRTRFVLDEAAWSEFVSELDRPPKELPAMAELLSGEYHRNREKKQTRK